MAKCSMCKNTVWIASVHCPDCEKDRLAVKAELIDIIARYENAAERGGWVSQTTKGAACEALITSGYMFILGQWVRC